MEFSRQAAIKKMVLEDMGVGIVPMQTARDELADGSLVAWWIEGARINWSLGLAWSTMTALLEHDPVVQDYRAFFALLDWSTVEHWQTQRPPRGRPAHPESAYLKAFLVRIREGLIARPLHEFKISRRGAKAQRWKRWKRMEVQSLRLCVTFIPLLWASRPIRNRIWRIPPVARTGFGRAWREWLESGHRYLAS